MKKIFFTIFIIPLVMFEQEVFASSFMYAGKGYATYSTSSQFLQNNNQKLKNGVCDYNSTLPENILNSNSSSLFDTYQQECFGQQKFTSPNSKKQQKTPDWWRQPATYEGWGFD